MLEMKNYINDQIATFSLTRIARIQLLSELLNDEINKSVTETLPDYVYTLLKPELFPISSKDFKINLIDIMPTMKSKEAYDRKALRHISLMKTLMLIETKGQGSRTTYYLTP